MTNVTNITEVKQVLDLEEIEELADEVILPWMKELPESAWAPGALHTMVVDNLPAGEEEPTLGEVTQALGYLQAGGAVVSFEDDCWTAI
ncbi:hypothetical protein LCGC14_1457130 [marine sediment metagenome]|uniref:Uncharacterized protein n=1 Tax=marine sediment metagenome TaxID=412755 RepID=A0A0F9LWU9_9ZZZZ